MNRPAYTAGTSGAKPVSQTIGETVGTVAPILKSKNTVLPGLKNLDRVSFQAMSSDSVFNSICRICSYGFNSHTVHLTGRLAGILLR